MQPTWIGHTLGRRYRLDAPLGQGGMSAVYRATDPNLKRTVAVKLIHAHLSSNAEFVRRFEQEAEAVAQLRHPNIIQVFDFAHDGEVYYMVLEYLPGTTLQGRLQDLAAQAQLMPLREAVNILAKVCDAVAYAHERNMVHRDLKPANVMLNAQGEPTLMDFGVARMLGAASHTATGTLIGTAYYMSPEQVQGKHPDGRADIYSLGVMLFEILAGRRPFEADSATTLMMMHLNEAVPDLRQLHPGLPRDLAAVVYRALAKDPAQRFQSAPEMARALRAADLRPSQATDAGTILEAAPPPTAPRQQRVAAPPPAATSAAPPGLSSFAPPSTAGTGQRSRTPLLLGGILAGGLLIVCIAAAAILGYNALNGGGPGLGAPTATEAPTQAPTVDFQATTDALTAQLTQQAPAPPTATDLPTLPPEPTEVIEPTATPAPAPTEPTGPYARIDEITLQDGRYIVTYETFGYTEVLPGMHVHFFFNTVPPEQAGAPAAGPWFVWGGPRPFNGYTLGDRPAAATQMCALAANPNHSIILNTGNCMDLPE